MDMNLFEEELLKVMTTPAKDSCSGILSALSSCGNPIPAEVADKMEDLWEEWCGQTMTTVMAKMVMDVAALPMPERPFFRKAMIAAVKVLLPPYLNHAPVVKATGVRDESLTATEISARVNRLLGLKNGCVLFLENSRRWGVAGTIDSINATLPVMPFNQLGSNGSVPLEVVLKDAVVLSAGNELSQLVSRSASPMSSTRFRMIVNKRRQCPVSDATMKLMAQCGCAAGITGLAFEKYWGAAPAGSAAAPGAGGAAAAAAAAPGGRRACEGRSLKEVEMLLDSEAAAGAGKFSAEETGKFQEFFERLKADTAKRESKLLAAIIAKISDRTDAEGIRLMLKPLAGKTSFWPADPAKAGFSEFEVWGELASKLLEKLAAVAAQVFDEDYLAALALKVPLKALNCVCVHISDEALCDMMASSRNCSADLLLWIWKNRKKRADEELLQLVNFDNISRILSSEEPPKAWGAARREMRAMLMDDQAFQGHLIAMLGGNTIFFGSILQSALFLSSSERQSLMVKLARQSKELQEYLESGAGQKILSAGIGKTETVASAPVNEPSYTSIKSHQALIKELDDIINIHVPENREALKIARAHGDFRENSGFDAAKERRNHLSRRRGELERELANIQPVVMAQVEVRDRAVIGSEIEVKLAGGKVEKYYLLGAWDGDPDRRFLSYRTRLGKAVLNCRIGDSFAGPDGKDAELLSVRTLPAEIITELDA